MTQSRSCISLCTRSNAVILCDCDSPFGLTNLMKISIKITSLIGLYLGAEGHYEQLCYVLG